MRSVGFDGVVSVQWKLNAISGIDDSNSTFNVTSGFLSFAPGVSIQRIHVQVCCVFTSAQLLHEEFHFTFLKFSLATSSGFNEAGLGSLA